MPWEFLSCDTCTTMWVLSGANVFLWQIIACNKLLNANFRTIPLRCDGCVRYKTWFFHNVIVTYDYSRNIVRRVWHPSPFALFFCNLFAHKPLILIQPYGSFTMNSAQSVGERGTSRTFSFTIYGAYLRVLTRGAVSVFCRYEFMCYTSI